ncbi:hypothetical protein KTQ42_18580 [Noviherbaspirillum sp. L7-7A]|uniref:SGNH hydrolase domain-containing protein n=1 Tax=Noviherbaspirillum sp. L7-7A TaxID=2850560 RepID=UPI001C2BA0BE|nr:SGNH hydrolase domain-containing protein [Noviherbaspirillum sp. L7-7A]MBV0881300.1 hypothetical protein [Noviherbaspirillum sp. L7-7A]
MCSESYSRTNPVSKGGTAMPRALLLHLRSPVVAAMRKLGEDVRNTRIREPFPALCPPAGQCSAFLDGRPTFFDTGHVSGYGNRLLFPLFRDFIKDVPGAITVAAAAGRSR